MFYPDNSLKSTNFSILCMTIVWGATCSLIQEAKGLISFCFFLSVLKHVCQYTSFEINWQNFCTATNLFSQWQCIVLVIVFSIQELNA